MPTRQGSPRARPEARPVDAGRQTSLKYRETTPERLYPSLKPGRPLPTPPNKLTAQADTNYRPRIDTGNRTNGRPPQGPVRPLRAVVVPSSLNKASDSDGDSIPQREREASGIAKTRRPADVPNHTNGHTVDRAKHPNEAPPRMHRSASVNSLTPRYDTSSNQKASDLQSNFPTYGVNRSDVRTIRREQDLKISPGSVNSSRLMPSHRMTSDAASTVVSHTAPRRVTTNANLSEETGSTSGSYDGSDSSPEMTQARPTGAASGQVNGQSQINDRALTVESSRARRVSSPEFLFDRLALERDKHVVHAQMTHERPTSRAQLINDRPPSRTQINNSTGVTVGDTTQNSDRSLVGHEVSARPGSGRRASVNLSSAPRGRSGILGGNATEDSGEGMRVRTHGDSREHVESGTVARQVSQSGYGPSSSVVRNDWLHVGRNVFFNC